MTQTNKNKPADTIRHGSLKAVIWANPGKDGKTPRYSIDYIRSYRTDDGQWKETRSLSEIDNLRLSHLNTVVQNRIIELKAADRQDNEAEEGGQ